MRENTQCEDKKMHEGKEKLDFITVLYGLAVLLVLFGHSHPLHTNWPLYMQEATAFVYKFHINSLSASIFQTEIGDKGIRSES